MLLKMEFNTTTLSPIDKFLVCHAVSLLLMLETTDLYTSLLLGLILIGMSRKTKDS